MDFKQLRYFIALAEHLNFTHAAEELRIGQPALSQHIARMERGLGVQLFERNSRQVTLTAAGALLLERARTLTGAMGEIEEELSALVGLAKGRLRIGAEQGAVAVFELADIVSEFHRLHPGVELEIRDTESTDFIDEVIAGDLDFAIVGMEPNRVPDTLTAVELARTQLVAILDKDHPLATSGRVTLGQLAAAGPFIDFPEHTGLRRLVDEAFAAAGISRSTVLEVSSIGYLCSYAAAGLGTALVQRPVIAGLGSSRAPAVLELQTPIEHPFTMIHRASTRLTPAAVRFLEILNKSC